jgi:hypothetical protein
VSLRSIDHVVVSERVVHRAERVPDWRSLGEGSKWRSLCGAPVGGMHDGLYEFEVAVALDPESWRLAANCRACLAVTERRELGTLS